jgi:hypothetical protein
MGKLLQVSGERQFQHFLQNRKMLCRMPVSISETMNVIGKTNFADADLAKHETQAAVLYKLRTVVKCTLMKKCQQVLTFKGLHVNSTPACKITSYISNITQEYPFIFKRVFYIILLIMCIFTDENYSCIQTVVQYLICCR